MDHLLRRASHSIDGPIPPGPPRPPGTRGRRAASAPRRRVVYYDDPVRGYPSMMRRLVLTLLVLSGCARGEPYDVVIRHGTVYDGTGQAPLAADVAIRGDSI